MVRRLWDATRRLFGLGGSAVQNAADAIGRIDAGRAERDAAADKARAQ
jgi:hypothetical protein